MNNDLQRCYAEQSACAKHLGAIDPESRGATLGLADWVAEEVLILTEATA